MDGTSEPEKFAPKTHDPRCMSLTSTEHPDVCDCRILAMIGDDEIRRIISATSQANG